MKDPVWYLDCYFHGALGSKDFPVNSYGPARIEYICSLASFMAENFDRLEILKQTKGGNPLPMNFWPGVSRPR